MTATLKVPVDLQHYDLLTLELGRIRALAEHLSQQLLTASEARDRDIDLNDLFVYSIMAEESVKKCDLVHDAAERLYRAKGGAK